MNTAVAQFTSQFTNQKVDQNCGRRTPQPEYLGCPDINYTHPQWRQEVFIVRRLQRNKHEWSADVSS